MLCFKTIIHLFPLYEFMKYLFGEMDSTYRQVGDCPIRFMSIRFLTVTEPILYIIKVGINLTVHPNFFYYLSLLFTCLCFPIRCTSCALHGNIKQISVITLGHIFTAVILSIYQQLQLVQIIILNKCISNRI